MLISIDNLCFEVTYEYEPAYDGGTGPNSEPSWPENLILHAVTLYNRLDADLLPFLNDVTIDDIEKSVLSKIHDRSSE
jgi:hypothetical protein